MPITAHRWALYAEVIRRETRRLLLRQSASRLRRCAARAVWGLWRGRR